MVLTIDAAGTHSQVQYTPNAALQVPLWNAPGSVTPGTVVYRVIRTTNVPGEIGLYGPGIVGSRGPVTFIVDSNVGPGITEGFFNTPLSGTHFKATSTFSGTGGGALGPGDRIVFYENSTPKKAVTFSNVVWTGSGPPASEAIFNVGGGPYGTGGPVTGSIANPANQPCGGHIGANPGGGPYTVEFDAVDASASPFNAQVAFSSDYGQTWGSALQVGPSPGVFGGFDIQRSGGVSLAGAAGSVFKATSLGGAYSAYAGFGSANPSCIVIPFYRRNSTTTLQTSASDPDCIVGLDSGTLGLCWLTGGVSAPAGTIDITPVAGWHPAGPDAVAISYGVWIEALGTDGVMRHSTNAGSTWGTVPFNGGGAGGAVTHVRRNDTSFPANRGAVYALNSAGAICYSSHGATGGAEYPRVMPAGANAVSFDVYP